LAHARRKFDELIKVNQSPVAQQAVQRIAMIYRVERGRGDELGSISQAEWARSVGLSEGRAGAATYAPQQPDRGAAASLLEATQLTRSD